jgi:hypothetical protein
MHGKGVGGKSTHVASNGRNACRRARSHDKLGHYTLITKVKKGEKHRMGLKTALALHGQSMPPLLKNKQTEKGVEGPERWEALKGWGSVGGMVGNDQSCELRMHFLFLVFHLSYTHVASKVVSSVPNVQVKLSRCVTYTHCRHFKDH